MTSSKIDAPRDENRTPTLMGVSSVTTTINGVSYVEGVTPVPISVNPITGEVQFEAP